MFKTMLANQSKNSQRGLSLIEVMISIAIVSITITALVTISNAAIASVDSSRNQAIADHYARQTLEATRVYRDQKGWSGLITATVPDDDPVMNVNDYRVFSLSGTNLVYRFSLIGSQTSEDLCKTHPKEAAFAIPGAPGFYRFVTVWRRTVDDAKITATICYSYRGNTNRNVHDQTILSDWH